MERKTRATVAFGAGCLMSLPASALIFNLLPEVALPLGFLFCAEPLKVQHSTRGHSHAYLCGEAEITARVSLVVWVALVVCLAGAFFALLSRPSRERR